MTSVTTLNTDVTVAAESNMSALQSSAHAILAGVHQVASGKASMMLALVPVLHTFVTFTHDKVKHTTYQIRDFDYGVRNEDLTKDSKANAAFFAAICKDFLGIDDKGDQGKIRQHFVSTLRAAIGASVVGNVTTNKTGELIVPFHIAFPMIKDDGTLTPAGVAAVEVATSRLNARAEVKAELSGEKIVAPSEDDINKAASKLPVVCNGKKLNKANNVPASPFGDLPTATEAMAKLTAYAVEIGAAEPVANRAARSGTPDEKAVATINEVAKMILAACDPEGDEAPFAPGPVTDAAIAALAKACKDYAKAIITH